MECAGGGGAGMDVELLEDILEMRPDRSGGDDEAAVAGV
jgi:hypothetical protein